MKGSREGFRREFGGGGWQVPNLPEGVGPLMPTQLAANTVRDSCHELTTQAWNEALKKNSLIFLIRNKLVSYEVLLAITK